MSERLTEMDRRQFERGIVTAAYRAAIRCAMEQKAIPLWAVPTVVESLQRDFDGANGRGKGRASPKIESRRRSIKALICDEVERLTTQHDKSKDEAFQMVADQLTKFRADGKLWTAAQVKTAYYRTT
jgi:hypothetical protein